MQPQNRHSMLAPLDSAQYLSTWISHVRDFTFQELYLSRIVCMHESSFIRVLGGVMEGMHYRSVCMWKHDFTTKIGRHHCSL